MSRRYPKAVHQFIRENVKGRTCAELTALVNREFGTDFTESKMKAYKSNHKLTSDTPCGNPKGYSPIFPADMEDFIRSVAPGRTTAQIAELVNEHYGRDIITPKQVHAYKTNRHIRSGVDCRFQKGHVSANKGKPMPADVYEKAKATMFKKGHTPANYLPVGSIVKNTDGYLMRKRSDTGTQRERWEFLHRAVWIEHNGPIPDDMMVSFKDGDKENCDIENLMLISNAENLELWRSGLRFDDPDLTETGLNIVKLKLATGSRRQKKRRGAGGICDTERKK